MTSERKRRTPSAATNGVHATESVTPARPVSEGPADTLAFEEALGRLDETVEALESGQLPLEEALSVFEEGIRLAQRCQEMLDRAELRVQRLRSGSPHPGQQMGGNFALDDLEIEEGE